MCIRDRAFPEEARRHREQIEALPVTSPDGDLVRLSEVAEVRFDLGASLVRREDVQRLAVLTANIEGAAIMGVVDRAKDALRAGLELPTGYRLTL